MSDDTARSGHSAHTPHTGGDDDLWWMSTFSALDDRDIDSLLSGDAPADGELAPIADLARALRSSAAAEPVPTMGPALQAQLAGGAVVAMDVARAARTTLVKAGAAAAVAAIVALTGVGAAQNRLPAGVQDVVSSTAELVGLDFPHADERGDDDDAVDADDRGDDGQPGYDGITPGGADPADPGVPGDKEPATPATPPDKGQPTKDSTPSSTVSERPDSTPSSTVPERPDNTPSSTVPAQGGPTDVEDDQGQDLKVDAPGTKGPGGAKKAD